ncbi:MAG: hypothetical protein IPI58_03040 [Alphaproteobacteria bacterium]|nr:MAG: hypothetical protein IPI58_03040 [Alphaproteobacteria bacterium]
MPRAASPSSAQPEPQVIEQALHDLAQAIGRAERGARAGKRVDLTLLGEDVAAICEALRHTDRDTQIRSLDGLEALHHRLDALAKALRGKSKET